MENKLTWEQAETMRLLQSLPGTIYQDGTAGDRLQIREWVQHMARKGVITVTFVKSDGTLREMKCTLDTDLMPAYKAPALADIDMFHNQQGAVAATKRKTAKVAESTEPKEDATIKVFDLDAQAWRSFRFDRLKNVSVEFSFQ